MKEDLMQGAEEEFERALIDLATEARDGSGRQVLLTPLEITADGLRKATRMFMSSLIDSNTVFIGSDEGVFQPSSKSEVAAWRNLALLAKATAAAVRAGR